MARFSNLQYSPLDGGRLMSRASDSVVGTANYTVKRDWRRDLDQEVRREGYDYFGDFSGLAVGDQPFPSTEEINLIHLARSPSGKTAVVVGTKSALYSFIALDYEYASGDSNGVYVIGIGDDPYFSDLEWQTLKSGFSSSGRRWEAANVNGYTVFNNGVDLPVVWRTEWTTALPLTELRDLGVAHVGTIAAFNNVMMLGDIREIPTADFDDWMNGVDGNDPYDVYPDTLSTNRFQYRLLWSSLNDPTEYGVVVKGTSTTGGSSTTLTMDFPAESFSAGDEIVVLGAGTAGGNLSTKVDSVSGTSLVMEDSAVTATTSAYVQKLSASASITGYDDLEDDASGILKMEELMGQLVIYKDTSNFLARYTGVLSVPFQFERLPIAPGSTLYYKNTLVSVDGKYHIYAGRNAFFKFDLQNRQPREIESVDLCSDIFFDEVSIADTDSIFAAHNANTKEVWFGFPGSGSDKVLCLDHRYDTVSTSSMNITAAATVKRPTMDLVPVETEDWFVMGNSAGTMLLYGFSDQNLTQWGGKDRIYYRRDDRTDTVTTEPYTSTLSSGLSNFGDSFNEKDIRSYVLHLSSQQESLTGLNLNVKIYGAATQTGTETLLANHDIDEPNENLVSLYARQHNYRDELSVTGKDNPVRFASRMYEVSGVASKSATRRDD